MNIKENLIEVFFSNNAHYSKDVCLAIDRLNEALLDEEYDRDRVQRELRGFADAAVRASEQADGGSPAQRMFDGMLLYRYGHAIVFGAEAVSEILEPALAIAVEDAMGEGDADYSPASPVEDIIAQGNVAIVTTISLIDGILSLRDSGDLKELTDGVVFLTKSLAELEESSVGEVAEHALSVYASFAEASGLTCSPVLKGFIRTEVVQRIEEAQ